MEFNWDECEEEHGIKLNSSEKYEAFCWAIDWWLSNDPRTSFIGNVSYRSDPDGFRKAIISEAIGRVARRRQREKKRERDHQNQHPSPDH